MRQWAEKSPIHGPAFTTDEDSSVVFKVLWGFLTATALIGTVWMSWGQIMAFSNGDVLSKVEVAERLDPVRVTYCSDDWVDVNKVTSSGLDEHSFAYFLSLLPGMDNQYDLNSYQGDGPEYLITGLGQFYDEIGTPHDRRIRYSRFSYLLDKSKERDLPAHIRQIYGSYQKSPQKLAENIANFAMENNLTDLLSFAKHFSRKDIVSLGTKEVGHSIHFGRFCRELEAANVSHSGLSVRRGLANFYVEYDYAYGSQSNNFSEYKTESHRIFVLPSVGVGIPSYLNQQRLLTALEAKSAIDFTDGIESQQLALLVANACDTEDGCNTTEWTLNSNLKDKMHAAFRNSVASVILSQETDIKKRPNQGKSPCLPNRPGLQAPTSYSEWECLDVCLEDAHRQKLREDRNCDYVGSGSLTVPYPCSCAQFSFKSLPSNPQLGMCNTTTLNEECVAHCFTLLPYCETHDTTLRLKETVFFTDREYHTYKNAGPLPENNRSIIPFNIQVEFKRVTIVSEYMAVVAADLIVGLGGTAGFFMGISVLALLHAVTALIQGLASVFGNNN